MPELPEVESIRLQLQRYLIGHKITDVEIRYAKKFEGDVKKVLDTRILGIRRFGKVQSIDLDNGYSIVIHIKLTGQLIYRNKNETVNPKLSAKIIGGLGGKHTHVIFHLDFNGKGAALYFNDVRKFGWIKIIQSSKLKIENEFLKNLGPEPSINPKIPPENVLTLDKFKNILSKTARAIKLVLMDQGKIAGIGNIYANDALWLAKIDPKRKSLSLGLSEQKELYDAIHTVLKSGLKYRGASELSFVTPDGAEGKYQDHTLVYGHEGEVCKRCKKAKLKKYFLSGRGTYWCSRCQH